MDQLNFKAIYGTFNQDMEAEQVTDVTTMVTDLFLSKGKIIIPAKTDFHQIFPNPDPGKTAFLQLLTGNRKYNIIEDSYHLDIEIDLNVIKKQFKLIYYAYINRNSNWKAVISGQLGQLKSYGLLDEADVYVHITDTTNVFDDVIDRLKDIVPHAVISTSNENRFEYHALKLAFDLAKEDPDTIFMYFHTKGMSYNIQSRTAEEIALLIGTFENWRKKLEPFQDPAINKVGLFPALEDMDHKFKSGSRGGWIWFNFWYARGNYLLSCGEPEIKTFRWYYEDWLGGMQDETTLSKKDCYNLYRMQNREGKTYFTAPESLALLWSLRND
ncbi:hypothetical protein [Pedobacter sp. L105]|uniref:hypothetical protein n=1 Tax=Pedobacter sp. L105 TaxID=1641871 RepID=UPI00131B2EC4|nr:hypothetical protein [Pedobacter sp. L105]